MSWNVTPLMELLGAELSGSHIATGSMADRRPIYDAAVRFGIVVIREQHDLSDTDLHELAASLPGTIVPLKVPSSRQNGAPGVVTLANIAEDGSLLGADDPNVAQNRANELWHADLTFQRPRASLSMLYARRVPTIGGDTEFCDTRLLWDSLTEEERAELRGLNCIHSGAHSRRKYGLEGWGNDAPGFPPIERPLILEHPDTGRIALSIGSYAQRVGDLDEPQSQILLDGLLERAALPQHVYTHHWQAGDLLIWDNRSMLHRARPFDPSQPRDMRALRLFDPANP